MEKNENLNKIDYYKQLETGINVLKELIEKYKNKNDIEIELRIGRIDETSFISGLNSKDFFNKIKENLDTCKDWSKTDIVYSEEIIYHKFKQINILDKNDIILNTIFQNKNKIENNDLFFENTPYDIRIAIASENIINKPKINKEEEKCKRHKKRYKYYYKDFIIDLTEVSQIINTVEKVIYELEVELVNLDSNMSNLYRSHSAFLLIRDFINFCEPVENDAELLLLEFSNLSMDTK